MDRVPWDDVEIQQPSGLCRLYHFRGFSLTIALASLPQAITPEQWRARGFTDEELSRPGVLWVAYWPPTLLLDGVQDRAERMRRYWKAEDEMIAEINARMRGNRQNREP